MRWYSRFQFNFISYKTIGFVCALLCQLLAACSRKTISHSPEVHNYCKLQQFKGPINLTFESIKEELASFERSRAPYEAFWVKVSGGNRLRYCRIQLQDGNVWSWSGEEGEKPQPNHRIRYQEVEQMFISIPSAHYTEQPFWNRASEPEMEAILVKKAGVTFFSYALDRDCLNNFAADDEAKISQAKVLSNYMSKML